MSLRTSLGAVLKGLRYPGGSGGGTPFGSLLGFGGYFPLQPGSGFDYRKAAGPLWLCGPVMAGINFYAKAWSEADWTVEARNGDGVWEPVGGHKALTFLDRPSRDYGASVLWWATLLSYLSDGNAYWYVERNKFDQPLFVRYLPHFLVEPKWPTNGSLHKSGYLYRTDGEEITLSLDDVIHFQWGMDPYNPRKGLSPLAAELRSVVSDNEISTFHAALLRNSGIPGVILSPKGHPGQITAPTFQPEQAKEVKRLWRERTRGENRGDAFVPSVPLEANVLGFSPEQLALDKTTRLILPRICAALGLDPMVLGLPSESKTYNNYGDAMEAAYERHIIPLQYAIAEQLTWSLLPRLPGYREGQRFGRDYSRVRVLQEDMDSLYSRLTKAVGGPWLTPNDARKKVGEADIAGGEQLYEKSAGPGEGEERDGEDGGEKKPAGKKTIGARWAARAARIVAERQAGVGPRGAR